MNIPLPNTGKNLALTMATLAFAANFSVWTLYAVLALELEQQLQLSATELGLLFSAPMLTGALLRIPAGLLTKRFNPKHLFTLQMLLVIPALFLLPYMQDLNSYLWLGLWIGTSGCSFSIGICYISDWFERNHQGTAMGIFGAGNAGAAITLILAPIIVQRWGWPAIGTFYGFGLLVMAALFAWLTPSANSHQWQKPSRQLVNIKIDTPFYCRLQVWRFGLYYYFVFGSFLALIMWLPQYYSNAYNMSDKMAMALTLIFVSTSSMVRALGGWFADKYGGRAVNWNVFWICLVCLFFISYPPTTMTVHGVSRDVQLSIEVNVWVFTLFIFIIGIAQGFGRASVYKILYDYYPNQMGEVGGFVAAIGALGGCTLPIAFGFVVDLLGIYSACFMLLYGVLAGCMIVMFFANKADRFRYRLIDAQQNNFLNED